MRLLSFCCESSWLIYQIILLIRDFAVDAFLKFSAKPVCERLVNGHSGEPLNIATALVVTLIACAAVVTWYREGRRDLAVLGLCVLAMLIGIGGFVFHLAPSAQTLPFEVVPSPVFIVACFALVLHRVVGLDLLVTGLNIAAFVLGLWFFILLFPADSLGGGVRYLAPLLALYILSAVLIVRARLGMHDDLSLTGAAAARSDALHFPRLKAGYGLLQAGILLALALVARALDGPLCDQVPLGLHWLWHVFGGLSVGKLLYVCLRFPHAPRPKEPQLLAG